jgi:hypothetical protein
MAGNARQHAGAYFLTVMKCEYKIGPATSGEHSMGSTLALKSPSNPFESGEHDFGLPGPQTLMPVP